MAIHEQQYVRYEGALEEGRAAWRIARVTFRTAWSLARTKLLLIVIWIMPLVATLLVFAEYSARNSQAGALLGAPDGAPGGTFVAAFLVAQAFSLAVLYMASGCGVISDDLRYRTFQLYFSKPITRPEYAAGKWLGLFGLGSLVTILPAAAVGLVRFAFWARTEFATQIATQVATGVGLTAAFTAVMASVVMGLSSATSHTRYVVLSWLGVVLVPVILSVIVAIATEGGDAAHLWSMTGNMWLVSRAALTEQTLDIPVMAPVGLLVAMAGAGMGAVAARIKRLEGVA